MRFSRATISAERTFYVLSGLMSLINSAAFVYLTIFYYSVVGLNPLQLVLVGTVLEGSILLFEIPTGVVADTYSRRLSVILGVFTLGLGFLLTGLSRNFGMVLLSQVICGLGFTFLSGALDAWLASEVGEEQVGPIYIRNGQITRVIEILGLGISAMLANQFLGLPILVGSGLYLLLGIGLALLMPERNFKPFAVEHAGESRPIRGFQAMAATFKESTRVIRGRPALVMLALVEFFVGTSSEGFDRLGDPHLLRDFVLPTIGTFKPVVWFSILALSTNLLSLFVTHLLRKRFEAITTNRGLTARVLMVFNLIVAGCGISFALARNFPLAIACLVLRGLFWSLSWPLFSAFLIQNIPPKVRATVMSMPGSRTPWDKFWAGRWWASSGRAHRCARRWWCRACC